MKTLSETHLHGTCLVFSLKVFAPCGLFLIGIEPDARESDTIPAWSAHLLICSLIVLRLQKSSDLSPLLLLSLLQPFVKLCIVLFFLCQNSSSLGTPDFCLTLECYFLLCIKLYALSCAGVGLWKDAWCDLTSSLIFCSVLFCFKFCLWQQTCLQFLCSEGFLFGTSICNKWVCYLQRYF